jgi:hypothetical protein
VAKAANSFLDRYLGGIQAENIYIYMVNRDRFMKFVLQWTSQEDSR